MPQLYFRNEEEILANVANPEKHYKEIILPNKLNIYNEYVANQSFIGDLGIIIKTIYSIFKKIRMMNIPFSKISITGNESKYIDEVFKERLANHSFKSP